MSAGEARATSLGFLAKHSAIYAAGSMLSRVASFLMLPLYTAYLTPFDYGVLDLIETTVGMFSLVASLGVAQALGRFYFDDEDQRRRNAVVSTTFIMATIAGVLVFLVSLPLYEPLTRLLFKEPVDPRAFLLAFVTIAIGLVIDLGMVYLRVVNRSILFVVASMANLVIGVGLNAYLIVVEKLGIFAILIGNLATKLVVGLPLLVWIVSRVGLKFDRPVARSMYRFGLPLMPSELASVAISYSDRYFINGFLSTEAAGIWGMAQKLGTALHQLITSPFLMAFVSQRFDMGRSPNATWLLTSSFRYHMVVLIVPSAVLALFAPEILALMTAPEFQKAGWIIPFAALSMIILATKYHFEYGILREKATHYHMFINTGSAALHVVLNATLIAWLGLPGAIIALLAAYLAKSVSYLTVSQKFFPIPYPIGQCTALLAASAVVVTIGLTFAGPGWTWMGLAEKSVLLVALAVLPFITKALSRGDLARVQDLLRRVTGRPVERA
ncbi:MAG TPA: lipopolysaccharide biosynthesis protein [Povalibacter sp.]|uniref:lipopolysaccharide biosynthesis protein n=1 Tax=Povalibacter sp. TaxID=1962978 RepID=UPI002D16C39C|nr:lipopolysaccharide biosynthesis protein [Povalibacter sp.]HMN42965.1 lipopolysaccharide biosynthesis protein [Povalibacter sp.]